MRHSIPRFYAQRKKKEALLYPLILANKMK